MSQAIIDPEEVRRFAAELKRFNGDLRERTGSLMARFTALGLASSILSIGMTQNVDVQVGARTFRYDVHTAREPGSHFWIHLVDCPAIFDRPRIYSDAPDEHVRYLLLTRAAFDCCQRLGFAPHIVHCNDWHTAFAPLLAALIAITLRSSPEGSYQFSTALHVPAYLFLSATVAMFLGLTNSATEVLRDRPILRRERNCQPGAGSYVTAKFVALGLVAAVQCFVYLVVGNYFLEIRGMLPYLWLWMTLTAWTGTAMAIVVSSLVQTERAALTAVPLLLVPQMLLAGALVPYKEMNRGLFINAAEVREKGGAPVPALVMPLRYAYEAMIVSQATQNPFEAERLRLQRRIDRVRALKAPMNAEQAERFDLVKEGLRRLLASGATTPDEALNIINRIRRISTSGTRIEVETMKVWPDDDSKARPASEFFVNERIDLMVREAETFRNDYRNKEPRNVFYALKKPLPFVSQKPQSLAEKYVERDDELETHKYCGFILVAIVLACGVISTIIISLQNRRTR